MQRVRRAKFVEKFGLGTRANKLVIGETCDVLPTLCSCDLPDCHGGCHRFVFYTACQLTGLLVNN